MLQDTEALAALPDEHRPMSVKVPFRVDLRDLATWLGKRDPFSPDDSAPVPAHWAKSLEAFLAAQVRHYSGGAEFTVADLHAVTKLAAVLIVLDGLDEVAELSRRREIVDEVVAGVGRLRSLAASLQVVVTSRPSVFGQALGFPKREYPHFQLTDLSHELITSYCYRWLAARSITGREAGDVRRILKLKIEQPHIRDLARNPMQLTILLSLIHTQGSSLPDKRTALYDSYVDLFLNREAEKSEVVRENRQLLVNLHRYLAWVLHSESQKGAQGGSVTSERLQQLLDAYLRDEGLDTRSLASLFSGMVERIVFLVSRVQGTYEFEVQPLREYFAARHLYETAPYSPPGRPRRGTKPDRFDAISRSSYWLNVARFFAGCFSKGELPCLIDRLHELGEDPDFGMTNQPRRLAFALLGDYVFSQDKRSTREAVKTALQGVALNHPLQRRHFRRRYYSEENVTLPADCGGEELVAEAMQRLRPALPKDYASELTDLLRANAPVDKLDAFWKEKVRGATDRDLATWLTYGLRLGSLPRCGGEGIAQIMSGRVLDFGQVDVLLDAGHGKYLEDSEGRTEQAINLILKNEGFFEPGERGVLARFRGALGWHRYVPCFENQTPASLRQVQAQYFGGMREQKAADKVEEHVQPHLVRCAEIVDLAERLIGRPAGEWATTLDPWDRLVEAIRSRFGDGPGLDCIALASARIRSTSENCTEFSDLLDHSKSLCRRARYARLRAASHTWWEQQLEVSQAPRDRLLAASLFFSWASPGTLLKLFDAAETLLKALPDDQWESLASRVRSVHHFGRGRRPETNDIKCLPEHPSQRLCVLVGLRAHRELSHGLYMKHLRNYEGKDGTILWFCERHATREAFRNPAAWPDALRFAERAYEVGLSGEEHYWVQSRDLTDVLPAEVAKKIVSKPKNFPRFLVYLAEGRCQLELESKQPSVSDTASAQRWFEPHPPSKGTTRQRGRTYSGMR